MKINFSYKTKLVASFLLLGLISNAQQSLPVYQQYIISDKMLINPSYIGSTDYFNVKGSFHKQWGSTEGGPNTQILSGHANIVDRLGAGAYFFRDENGPVFVNGGNIGLAYHIPLNDTDDRSQQFSFGTSLSLFNQTIDRAKLIYDDADDVSLSDGHLSVFLPYVNLGMSVSISNFFAGFSVLDIPLGEDKPIVNSIEPLPTEYYLNLGYNWRFAENFSAEPSLLFNLNSNSEKKVDANLKLRYYQDENEFTVGASYRQYSATNSKQNITLSPFIEAKIGRLNMGLLYNMGISDIYKDNSGGFTISLGYDIDNIFNSRGFRY